jgi:hypothetical protein
MCDVQHDVMHFATISEILVRQMWQVRNLAAILARGLPESRGGSVILVANSDGDDFSWKGQSWTG